MDDDDPDGYHARKDRRNAEDMDKVIELFRRLFSEPAVLWVTVTLLSVILAGALLHRVGIVP